MRSLRLSVVESHWRAGELRSSLMAVSEVPRLSIWRAPCSGRSAFSGSGKHGRFADTGCGAGGWKGERENGGGGMPSIGSHHCRGWTGMASTSGPAERRVRTALTVSMTSGWAWFARTKGRPGLAIAAFSCAILATVFPKKAWWSRSTAVKMERAIAWSGTTFVASRRPPMPTSSTTMSVCDCWNIWRATRVRISKLDRPVL